MEIEADLGIVTKVRLDKIGWVIPADFGRRCMETQDKSKGNISILKQAGLFIGGVLVVAGLVLLINSSGNTNIDNAPVVANTPTELPKETNLEETESSNVTNRMTNQKMTAEQKIAIKAPAEMIDTSEGYTATLNTSLGSIVIELDVKNRPRTVNNFVYLARSGFYDDVVFHRVIDGFMIQGGDPLGTGTGGPAYKFADELTTPNSNTKGTISMANAGPNTNGSQFFINLVNNNYLDTKHTVFGKVTGGMDVVEKIGRTPVDQNDRPLAPVTINSVEIVED